MSANNTTETPPPQLLTAVDTDVTATASFMEELAASPAVTLERAVPDDPVTDRRDMGADKFRQRAPDTQTVRRFGAGSEETLGRMDESQNVTGTRLTCTNADCDCELQINRPCPHGTTYTCACGHPLEPTS